MKTLRSLWATFAKALIPANAPAIQRDQLERSFYAGASAALAIIGEATTDDVEGTAAGQAFDKLNLECREWSDARLKAH